MSLSPRARRVRLAAALAALVASAGCASLPPGELPSKKDPYERFNRSMFQFNDTLDKAALKPAAEAYVAVVPSPVRTGVDNVFGNFADAWSAVNQLLQGKVEKTARMTMRVVINTTIGIAGIFDPATKIGLDRQSEDFGQTLGRWGVAPGPYLVLPLFGPSDIRDGVALPLDRYVTPALLPKTTGGALAVDALGVVATRADYLQASSMLNDIALDRYTFLRDAYLARRRSQVYDGDPPDEDSGEPPPPPDDGGASGPPPAGASAPAAPAASAPASPPAAPASAPSAHVPPPSAASAPDAASAPFK